jgi:hypothetical protein
MVDKPWEEGAIKVIRKAFLLYLFIFTLEIGYFISFQNQWHLPYCKITISFSQKRRVIKVRIGKPISVAEQNEYKTTELYSEFLRKRPTCWPILTIKFKLLTAPHLKIPEPLKKSLLLLTAKNNWKSMLRNTDCRLLQSKTTKCFLPKRIRFSSS